MNAYDLHMTAVDLLDMIELRLITIEGSDAFKPELWRLQHKFGNLKTPEELASTAAEVAVLAHKAPHGSAMDEVVEVGRQRNQLLAALGKVSFQSMKDAIERCGYTMSDIFDNLPGNEPQYTDTDMVRSDADRRHILHTSIGGFIDLINEELQEGEKIAFDQEWDCYTPDNIAISHTGEYEHRVSTVTYGKADDPLQVSFDVPNPMHHDESPYSNFDLVKVAKDAFYGYSPYYPGPISRCSLNDTAAKCVEALNGILNDPRVMNDDILKTDMHHVSVGFQDTFAPFINTPVEAPRTLDVHTAVGR